MPKGISIHVGVNSANLAGVTVPILKGCENDARDMRDIAVGKGFNTEEPFKSDALLLSPDATYERVVAAIERASENLVDGDFFLFTFSGHGTRQSTFDQDEPDLKDESIVLHDKILIDDVFRRGLWPRFKNGVRILAISDCCHGAGVFFLPGGDSVAESIDVVVSPVIPAPDAVAPAEEVGVEVVENRELPKGANEKHFNVLRPFYDEVRNNLPAGPGGAALPIDADLLVLSACREHEKAKDGTPNGLFTAALLEVLRSANPPSDYGKLQLAIKEKLAGKPQLPQLTPFDPLKLEFMEQRPFEL